MIIDRLDHLVLTVQDIAKTIDFYTTVLNFSVVTFGDNRKALTFGAQKINLHEKGKEIDPKAAFPTCGSADLCFITSTPIEEVLTELQTRHIEIVDGIVPRTGATGKIRSIYLRDPDLNLVEISSYA